MTAEDTRIHYRQAATGTATVNMPPGMLRDEVEVKRRKDL
jgi:hypothetical protein